MTAEGRGRSRERTDTIRSLSRRRREGGKEGGDKRDKRGDSIQYNDRKRQQSFKKQQIESKY